MPTITFFRRTIKAHVHRAGGEIPLRDGIVAPERLYVVVAALLALAFAAIAARGFGPTLAMASALPSEDRVAESGYAPAMPVTFPAANALAGQVVGDIVAPNADPTSVDSRP